MIQIRQSIFETNSSSVHSITMVLKSEYERWENGEVLHNGKNWWNKMGELVSREKALAWLRKEYPYAFDPDDHRYIEDESELLEAFDFTTPEQFYDNDYETFYDDFTTPSGETVVAFGYYGENR